MKAFSNYAEVQVNTGSVEKLPVGGYVITIKSVKYEDNSARVKQIILFSPLILQRESTRATTLRDLRMILTRIRSGRVHTDFQFLQMMDHRMMVMQSLDLRAL